MSLRTRSVPADFAGRGLAATCMRTGADEHENDDSLRPLGRSAPDPVRSQALVHVAPPDRVERRTFACGDDIYADVVEAADRGRVEFRFCAPLHLLAVYERGTRQDGESFVEGLAHSRLRDLAGKLTFIPAGHEFIEWHEPRLLPRVSYFYFNPAALEAQTPAGLSPRLLFADQELLGSALKPTRALEAGGADNRLYVDALAVVLAHEVSRLNAAAVETPGRGGLAGWQQRNVTAYIEEHLPDRIELATLARLARLSPFHFARAFKQSLGLPPHRYHVMRRIERAKILLAARSMSVTEVGIALGFAQTSTFSAAFHRATGVTPTQYQRSPG